MDLREAELPLESHARKRERLALVSSVRVGLVSRKRVYRVLIVCHTTLCKTLAL